MLNHKLIFSIVVAAIIAAVIIGCGGQPGGSAPLGSESNPVKIAMVPSLDTAKLMKDGEKLAEMLEKETGLKYEVSVPPSYTAVVNAMGAGTVDVGWLSPIPYVIAHDQYGVEVILRTIRDNSNEYWGFIIARNDGKIKKLADLKGKKFAYGDPVSTSGCIYPKNLIRTSGFDPEKFFSEVVFAGGHDKVVRAVYNNNVDAGAIYGGVNTDAREKVMKDLPDVLKKTVVIAKTESIPNDTVSVGKNVPPDVVEKVKKGLLAIAKSDAGRETILNLYGIDNFEEAKDADYDGVRKVAKAENIKLEQFGEKK